MPGCKNKETDEPERLITSHFLTLMFISNAHFFQCLKVANSSYVLLFLPKRMAVVRLPVLDKGVKSSVVRKNTKKNRKPFCFQKPF